MPIIDVRHLHKRYGGTVAVDDVTLSVEEGEIFGILGPNGAGKTTAVECLIGLRQPDGGQVRVLGLDPQRDGARLREQVGVQLQESRLPDAIRVGETLELYASFYRDPADPAALLDDLGLGAKAATAFGDLSGGQQQRLSIALALIGRPKLAILDELTTGLDPQARRDTWHLVEQVRASGVTVVLVTHFMDEAERLCDRLAIIDRGRVVATDTPAGLIGRVEASQLLRLRTVDPLDPQALLALPEVDDVTTEGEQLQVRGGSGLLYAVSSLLHRTGNDAVSLRMGQATLDDAFVALTGRPLRDDADEGTPAGDHQEVQA